MSRSVEDFASQSAFPALDDSGSGLHCREFGLTKREYFAAAALAGILASSHNDLTYDAAVRDACVYADKLLEELPK